MAAKYIEIDVQTALQQQADGILLLDVREEDEFEAGHAVGAVSIPLSELKDRVGEIDRTVSLNIICKSGGRSAQAAITLNDAGYKTANVKGGSLEWLAEQQPFVSNTSEEPKII